MAGQRHFGVSIHAPVVGATQRHQPHRHLGLFQSTLPWWERLSRNHSSLQGMQFQSTLPWWERRNHRTITTDYHCFNPRSRGGSDKSLQTKDKRTASFNPRSRGGSDQDVSGHVWRSECFNPRSRGGSDRDWAYPPMMDYVSIHAPVVGATIPTLVDHHRVLVSIHAPVVGATSGMWAIPSNYDKFQSTLPWWER